MHSLRDRLTSNETNLPQTFFDTAIAEVFNLMERDGFIRFVGTDEYREFVGVQDPSMLEKDYWIDEHRCCDKYMTNCLKL